MDRVPDGEGLLRGRGGAAVTDEAEAPKADLKTAEADDGRKRREFFVYVPLRIAIALQKRLSMDKTGYLGVIGHTHADARAYFLYGTLDEVIKTSVSGIRWLEFLGDPEESARAKRVESEHAEHIIRLIRESVIDEQEMWVRKLTEILFDLVLFSTTNEQDFYRLYLVCKQLDAYVGLQADFEEFFGCRNANADSMIQLLLQKAEDIRRRIDLTRAWFLRDGVDLREAPGPGQTFRSARQRFIRAQTIASSDVRPVLSPSYEFGYSTPSRSVHPNVGGPTREFTLAEVERNLSRVGLLGSHIVTLAHRLAGVEPEGEAKQIAESLGQSDGAEMFRRVFQRELEVGDIVFAYGEDLCQIIETAKSKYGNTSYKVRYLVRPLIPDIVEDWFPARFIHLLYRRGDIKPGMVEALRRVGATEAEIAEVERVDESKIAEVLARTFVDLEKRGLLKLMLKPPREERE